MSIVTMMRDAAGAQSRPPTAAALRLRRRLRATPEAETATQRATVETIASDLTRYIPTEALALYTAILPFLVPDDTALDAQDYTSRWWLAIGIGVLAVLFAVGVYKRAVEAERRTFTWPPRRTLTVVLAYTGWVFVIPGSPCNDFGWYTPPLGAIVGLVIIALISLFSLWFGDPES